MQSNKLLLILPLLWFSCSSNNNEPDAYGNFEATDIRVSAMASGQLLYLNVNEGMQLNQGQQVGQIDTIRFHLKKEQLKAAYQATASRKPGILTQVNVLEEQKRNASKELERFQKLASEGAVPQKQADDLRDRIMVLERQIKNIWSQNDPLISELKVIDAQIAEIDQQIKDAKIISPISGTVLTKLAEPHELVASGMLLFRIANLDTMILKAYIDGAQLASIKLGEKVEIIIDKGKAEYENFQGQISWISPVAEFTPKTIQTKEERTDLVYAIKIKTPNPKGLMKIGMPAEVIFNDL